MKVIDLLNKIANGEITELHKFKWNERIWEEYSKFEKINNEKSYQEHRQNGVSYMRFENVCDARHFNDEIEIIEEDKEIKKLEVYQQITANGNEHNYINYNGSKYAISTPQRLIIENQNKLIKEVNKLKKEVK